MAEDELLTVEQVAGHLKVKAETVRGWIRRGHLKAVRLGGQAGWRVQPHDLERFVAARHTGSDDGGR